MPALFPNSVRIFTSKTDLIDTVLADHVNLLQDEVTAVETALGTSLLVSTWSGSFATPSSHASVSSRLANIEAGVVAATASAASAIKTTGGTLTGGLSGTTAAFSGALTAGSLSGNGSGITALNAANLTSGTVPSARMSGSYTINASTASRWETARTLSFSGDVSGSVSIDGSANITASVTTPNSVSRSNGTVSAASVSQTVVRNITISTSDPTSGVGSEGDVWLKTLA